MYIVLGVLFVLLGMTLIWFNIPYSPTRDRFDKDVKNLISENQNISKNEVFTNDDFSHLPITIQKYLEECGYLGKQKMAFFKIDFRDVKFMLGKDNPLRIDYTQYNFVEKPNRLALISSRMYGIPFEGYDNYQAGKGQMKGVIGKVFPLFNQKGVDMDKACLVTFLAESLFAPTILLQDYIDFEQIDDFRVKATISYKGQSASGIFTFNESYEMISFTTDNRAMIETDGSINYIPWSAICSQYKVSKNGIKHPTNFKGVWNYPDNDFVYFDGNITQISYDIK